MRAANLRASRPDLEELLALDPRVSRELALVDAVAVPVLVAFATFIAATPWIRAFAVSGTTLIMALASIGSVAFSIAATRILRRTPSMSYAASAGGLILLLVLCDGVHPLGIWHGLSSSPNRLLTETLPLSGGRAVLAASTTLVWLCGFATMELLLRSRRDRIGAASGGLAIPVVAFVIAYAVSVSRPGRVDVVAPTLLVTVALIAVERQMMTTASTTRAGVGSMIEEDAAPSIWRPGWMGGFSALVVAAVLALIITNLPDMSKAPVSVDRSPPTGAASVTDPLGVLSQLRDGQPKSQATSLLVVNTDAPSNGYLAMAVLDSYDGALWNFDTTFHPTGGRIPPAGVGVTVLTSQTTVVTQHETILQALPVPFLPAIDRPISVRGIEVVADSATGMLLPGRRNGDRMFTIVSRSPDATLATTPPADGIAEIAGPPLPGTTSPADLALPANSSGVMSASLRSLSALAGVRPAPTVVFLQELVAALHAHAFRLDFSKSGSEPVSSGQKVRLRRSASPSSTGPQVANKSSGTSLSEAINAVGARLATPEQFATLIAMVARYLGIPARVATGFRLSGSSAKSTVPAGMYDVTNRDAWTWVEVPVAGMGWVVVDPTPDATKGPSAPPSGQFSSTATTLPLRANAVPIAGNGAGHAISKPASTRVSHSSSTAYWLVPLLSILGVLLLASLVGPGQVTLRRRLRRRARRAHSDPRPLSVGAWLELLDGLQQAGMIVRSGTTSDEVAADAGLHFGQNVVAPVAAVGHNADRAVFAISDGPDPDDADRAWRTQRAVRETVHSTLDRRQRSRALLTVGHAPREPYSGPG